MKSKPKKTALFLTLLLFVSVFVVGCIIFGFLYYRHKTAPVDSKDQDPVEFTVESGESVSQISQRLEEENLVRSSLFLKLYLKQHNLSTQIQAGDFVLRRSMTLPQVALALTKASSQQIIVTLLEGWRVEEVAAHLEKELTKTGLDFDPDLFLSLPEIKEGYVFPDTYYVALNTTEQTIAKTIEANFNQKIQPLQSQIQASPYSLDEILTMASIIEREARTDRAIVSGILWKRLENDWPLQADATLQYARGYNQLTGNWWTPPMAIDKELDSPYNSYTHVGLPPAPIANPSLASIEAALNPVETEYWFYITAPDGSMHYGVTYDDHLININRYLR